MGNERSSRLHRSARNLRQILSEGHIANDSHTEFSVDRESAIYRLRHYKSLANKTAENDAQPILFVPPLMVAIEIYDISPEQSAVYHLQNRNIDVWAVDFGAPENEPGGIMRTVGDHVLAVVDAITYIYKTTKKLVHVAGYSQGGMFVYEAVAYLKSKGVASLITFGSPVNVRLAVSPWVQIFLVDAWIRAIYRLIKLPLKYIPFLPGWITSAGFRLFSLRKEFAQVVEFVRILHDRELLARREPRRAFIRGDGFVAWPGPAFRDFVRDIIVHNRLAKGHIRIGEKEIDLADITAPILCFVGRRDEMVKAPGAHSIATAAVNANCYTLEVSAGHFGLVVGQVAVKKTWPSTANWIKMVTSGEKLERTFRRLHSIT